MLGKEKLALAENTIVAQCVVKDCVRIFGSVTNVPITKDVITAARRAYVCVSGRTATSAEYIYI